MAFDQFATEDLLKNFNGNKYMLVNVAALRARQINDGVRVYVKSDSRHPLQTALEEIAQGFIGFTLGADEISPEDLEPEEDVISFDEMVNLDGDFDFEDEEAFDIEPLDFEDDFAGMEEFGYEVEE